MSGIQPSDVRPESPGDRIGDPFAPLSEQLEDLELIMGMILDNPREWTENLFDEILELSPEERFTSSIEVFQKRAESEFGSAEAVAAQFPSLEPEKGLDLVTRLLERLLTRTFESLFYVREGEPYLTVTSGYFMLHYGLRNVDIEDEDQARIVFSTAVAFFARLYNLVSKGELTDEDRSILLRDVGRTAYYIEGAVDDERSLIEDPEAIDEDELRARIRGLGSVLAYSNLNISVSRGAELANLSELEFRELLEEYDAEPRYGPADVSELYHEIDSDDE